MPVKMQPRSMAIEYESKTESTSSEIHLPLLVDMGPSPLKVKVCKHKEKEMRALYTNYSRSLARHSVQR